MYNIYNVRSDSTNLARTKADFCFRFNRSKVQPAGRGGGGG